jgi:hypothetical protein
VHVASTPHAHPIRFKRSSSPRGRGPFAGSAGGKAELDRTYISGIERGLLTTLFGDLTFDRANDPLIHVCDLLRFVRVTAFFAQERIIGEIFVVQVNCGIGPRLSPTSQPVEHLSGIYTVEFEMKFFAHDGHNYLARFVSGDKPFL